MDTKLRLEATLKNNASPGLKQIGKDLKEVRRTPGMEEAQKALRGLSETTTEFVKGGGGVTSIMGAIGIGGLTAAVSLGELVKSFKELGASTVATKEIGREIGMTVDQMNEFRYAASRLRVDPDKAVAGLETLSTKLQDTKRGVGELAHELASTGHSAFAVRISHESTEEAVKDIGDFLGSIDDPKLQKQWAELFFGDGSTFSQMFADKGVYAKMMAEAKANVAPMTEEFLKQEASLARSVVQFQQAWTNFEVSVGPMVFSQLKQAADNFREIFDQIKPIVEWAKGEQGKSAGQIAGDIAGLAKGAVTNGTVGWLRDQEAVNEARRKAGNGPLIDLPGALVNGTGSAVKSEDGNALHRSDEMPVAPKKSGGGWFGNLFGGSVEKSAFTTGFGDRDNPIAQGVKEGVIAAYREMMTGSAGTGGGGGGEGGGIQNAAYTTWGAGGAPRAGGGSPKPWQGLQQPGSLPAWLGAGGTGGGDADAPSRTVDTAMKLRGAGSSEAARALGSRMTPGEWCADFVNGAMKASGMKGVNSSMARAFSSWGTAVGMADVKKGDVILERHGNHIGHVGLATGPAVRDKAGNIIGVPMISGNYGHAVRQNLERPDLIGGLRRAIPDLAEEARKSKAAHETAKVEGSIDAHIHLHQDGRLKGARAESSGSVKPPVLKRAPTMVQSEEI